MKSLLRSSPVQASLAFIVWVWMVLVSRSVRWRVEGTDTLRAAWDRPGGLIVANWHSRVLLLPVVWTRYVRHWDKKRPAGVAMLISLSPDGAFISRTLSWLGVKPIRGSAANKRKRNKDKGGTEAIRVASRLIDAGGALCITPDGPRGPRQRASMGAILLARRTGAPILIYGIAAAPCLRLSSWDRFMLPFPLTRGAIIIEGLLDCPRGVDPETLRRELEERLNAVTRRAEEQVGLTPTEPAPALLATPPGKPGPVPDLPDMAAE